MSLTSAALKKLIRRAVQGETWASIGAAFYPGYAGNGRVAASLMFGRHATAEDRAARAAAIAARPPRSRARSKSSPWTPDAIARLNARAIAGDPWKAIGAEFYPNASPVHAADAARIMWSKHCASESDKKVRAQAIRKRNWNRAPGLSIRAGFRHRARLGKDAEFRVIEANDPFAGEGACFA
jgi:hypothetical protein